MDDTRAHNSSPGRDAPLPRMYSPQLQPLLQSLLSTLADIDFEYERERDKLSKNPTDTNLKIRILEKLRSQHRERREPYIQQLALLQKRIFDLTEA